MTQNEIKDFKKFMVEQNAFMVFEKTYSENRWTINPKNLEDYLELTRATGSGVSEGSSQGGAYHHLVLKASETPEAVTGA